MLSTPLINVNLASDDVADSFRGAESKSTFPVLMCLVKKSPVRSERSGIRNRAYFDGLEVVVVLRGEDDGESKVTVW